LIFMVVLISGILAEEGFPPPDTPRLFATTRHHRVFLAWDSEAEASIDSVTGYADFEGYRIYKSTDGGDTWGGPDQMLYDYDGNFVGWKPYAQFDLTEDEDEEFCLYGPDCANNDPKREIEISGPDPLNPRFSLGENSGLQHTFVDSNVTDGVEYTYSVISYDMGLRTFDVEFVWDDNDSTWIADSTWSPSNPDHFIGPDSLNGNPNTTLGYPSLECNTGSSQDDLNFVTVIPGYYASNVSFPSEDEIESFFIRQESTLGTGGISYIIVDRDSLSSSMLRFEIQADLGSTAGEGMACENPVVYVYEITDSVSQNPAEIEQSFGTDTLTASQIDSLLDLPGATESGSEIFIPLYRSITEVNRDSEMLDGIRFRFDNIQDFIPEDQSALVDTVIWFADSSTIDAMEGTLTYFNTAAFNRRLNFDYKIELYSAPTDSTSSQFCSSSYSRVPLRVTNITTGRQVVLKHLDQGYSFPPPLSAEGFGDCEWTRNEPLIFQGDTLEIDTVLTPVQTFTLTNDFDLEELLPGLNDWSSSDSYQEGDMVQQRIMAWEATEANSGVEPYSFIDDDDDGINDSPWKPYYPWSDGEYLIVKMKKFFTDGDAWVVDMSEFGKSHEVKEDDLDLIRVVPNPYIVHSAYNEKVGSRLLRFTRLPNECRILIYTITGELVTSLEQSDPYEGNLWWNLRSGHNQDGPEVAPGLYIYVVEVDDRQRVGKFAIVR